ncbi:hypothetical protein GCM10010276_53630 [Streptomyces longisporus]|uniref:DUF397 domain-containing protein n=2 Tax=Streptomyces longisporus TaxID=1948 RepID=A0ABP5ZVL5_STRLO
MGVLMCVDVVEAFKKGCPATVHGGGRGSLRGERRQSFMRDEVPVPLPKTLVPPVARAVVAVFPIQPRGRHQAFTSCTFRSSTYSGGNNECVEVADDPALIVPIRDSKRPAGPARAFSHEAWNAFIGHLR